MKDIEARLEIGMAATVEAARLEKDAWGRVRIYTNQNKSPILPIRQLVEERYLYWQREEELRRKALKAWREHNEG